MTASSPAAPLSVWHGSTLLWSLRQLCLVIPLRQAVSHHYRLLIKSGMSQWQCPSVGTKRRQPANSVWERGSRDEWSTAPHLRDGKWQCCKCVCVSERECLHECPLVHKRCVVFSAVCVGDCVCVCMCACMHKEDMEADSGSLTHQPVYHPITSSDSWQQPTSHMQAKADLTNIWA